MFGILADIPGDLLHVVLFLSHIYTCISVCGVPCTYRPCTISHLLWNRFRFWFCLPVGHSASALKMHRMHALAPDKSTLRPQPLPPWLVEHKYPGLSKDGPGLGARSIGSAPMPALVSSAPRSWAFGLILHPHMASSVPICSFRSRP